MQFHGPFQKPVAVHLAERNHRFACKRLEACKRFTPAVAHGFRDILGEGHHPTIGEGRLEAEAMRDRRWHQDRAGRLEGDAGGLEGHLAAAAPDQQDLEQVAVTMGPDRPVVNRGTRCDGLDMNEVERLVVRGIAVEMKQWERRGGHVKS